jgi:hypothetical protein
LALAAKQHLIGPRRAVFATIGGMKRSLKWLVVFAGLALVGFGCYLWLAPSGGINRLTALRIKTGMSYDEVDAVIGLPHGDHCSTPENPIFFPGRQVHRVHIVGIGNVRYWHGDAGTITVWFDNDGKVTKRHFSPWVPSFFDKVYQWVGVDTNVPRTPMTALPRTPLYAVEPEP